MPGYLLHVGATVVCKHGGNAQPLLPPPNPRVKVGGQPIVTPNDLYAIVGCGLGLTGCKTAKWTSNATRVLVGGVPVLLQDSQSICAPTNTELKIVTTQTRVRGQ